MNYSFSHKSTYIKVIVKIKEETNNLKTRDPFSKITKPLKHIAYNPGLCTH